MTDRDAGHAHHAAAALRIALLSAALACAAALGFPAQAGAAAPAGLEGVVAGVVREDAEGPVAWARYVETTPDVASELLGKRREQLSAAVPGRVYLVMLCGDFAMPGGGEGRGPYLAFLYWRSGDTWEATDFTLLQDPVRLRSAGVPRALEPLAVTHPTLDRLLLYAAVVLFWCLPPVLLVVCAVLCLWRRRSAWPYGLAALVAAAVAVWQVSLVLLSLRGQPWDPGFHGAKLGVLAVVVAVDLAAVRLLRRRRSRLVAEGAVQGGPSMRLSAGPWLLLAAAALYVVSLFWLAGTGA